MSACQQCLVSLVKINGDPERYECPGCNRVFDRCGRPEGGPDFGKSYDPVVSRENKPNPSIPAKPPVNRVHRPKLKHGPRPQEPYFPA